MRLRIWISDPPSTRNVAVARMDRVHWGEVLEQLECTEASMATGGTGERIEVVKAETEEDHVRHGRGSDEDMSDAEECCIRKDRGQSAHACPQSLREVASGIDAVATSSRRTQRVRKT